MIYDLGFLWKEIIFNTLSSYNNVVCIINDFPTCGNLSKYDVKVIVLKEKLAIEKRFEYSLKCFFVKIFKTRPIWTPEGGILIILLTCLQKTILKHFNGRLREAIEK